MSKHLDKELELLEKEGVISTETAGNIRAYYQSKSENPHTKLFVVFAILGAILVGLGIILIIAHNWDELSRPVKVFFAFLPLVVGQLFCAYSLLKKSDSPAWKEGSTAFLFFAVGASISLISQVYNIHGDLSTFLFTWMLLCCPLIYVMNSSMASLLYIVGITYYVVESHTYWSVFRHVENSYHYWWLLLLMLPHYFFIYKRNPDSNSMIFHNWVIPLSLIFALATLEKGNGTLLSMAYMSMFGLFYLIGDSTFFQTARRRVNGYLVIGSLGTVHILLMTSFSWYWEEVNRKEFNFTNVLTAPEFIATVIITALSLFILVRQGKEKIRAEFHPMKIIFILFIVLFSLGQTQTTFPIIAINLIILLTGVYTIRNGARYDHLGVLNYGLLTITALVVCRFFDSDMSYIVRGLLFVVVGIGFFLANYLMLKKRKAQDAEKIKPNEK